MIELDKVKFLILPGNDTPLQTYNSFTKIKSKSYIIPENNKTVIQTGNLIQRRNYFYYRLKNPFIVEDTFLVEGAKWSYSTETWVIYLFHAKQIIESYNRTIIHERVVFFCSEGFGFM